MSKTRLKPCPFCGERKHLDVYETGGATHITCESCWAEGPGESGISDTDKKAIAAWNRRAKPKEGKNG